VELTGYADLQVKRRGGKLNILKRDGRLGGFKHEITLAPPREKSSKGQYEGNT